MNGISSLYLLGCLLVIALTFVKVALNWAVTWITKDNIYLSNIKKILPPKHESFLAKFLKFIAVVAFETLLSWINVFVILWQIGMLIVVPIRNLLEPKPEEAKKTLFPLRNNPNLERETVWALTTAFAIQFQGKQPNADVLLSELYEIRSNYPSFNCRLALDQLRDQHVAKEEIIRLAMEGLEPSPVKLEPGA